MFAGRRASLRAVRTSCSRWTCSGGAQVRPASVWQSVAALVLDEPAKVTAKECDLRRRPRRKRLADPVDELDDDVEEEEAEADGPLLPPKNAFDKIAMRKYERQRRQDRNMRFHYAIMGLIVTMIIPVTVVYTIDFDELRQSKQEGGSGLLSKDRLDSRADRTQEFAGRPVVVQPGTAKARAHDPVSGDEIELVPTGNQTVPFFPRVVRLPGLAADDGFPTTTTAAAATEYTLLGLGIRTVSFLSVQVYVVGIYVPSSSLAALQASLVKHVNPAASSLIPAEQAALRHALLRPHESEQLWTTLLTDPAVRVPAMIRVVPVRNTDFAHLRDGWVRGVTARTQAAALQGVREFDDQAFGDAVRRFKAVFGARGKAAKGSILSLIRREDGSLLVTSQEKEGAPVVSLGTVPDERISRLILSGYLAGKSVSSESARQSVVDGIMAVVARPLGTIEAKVE